MLERTILGNNSDSRFWYDELQQIAAGRIPVEIILDHLTPIHFTV